MHKRTLIVGIFLLAMLILIGAFGLTAEAGIAVDDGLRTFTLTSGTFNMDTIYADGSIDGSKLLNYTDGTWLSNYSLIVDVDAVLEISPNAGSTGCTWLKLNTSANVSWTAHINVTESAGGGVGGILHVNDTMITGWNWTGNCNMSYVNLTTERPWIFIHGGYEHNSTSAYFLNSTLGYLGYNSSDRYGIVYKDINTTAYHYPVGWMHNCTVLENYIGIAFQGVKYMNVTNSYFNDSKEAGIVYTSGSSFGGIAGPTEVYYADYGYVGDIKNTSMPCQNPTRDGVDVVHISGTADPDGSDGIRLYHVDYMTFDDVVIDNCTNMGLRASYCTVFTANNTIAHHCTDAADNYNIYLYNCTTSAFTNCSAYTPDGTADGGNWMLAGGGGNNSYYNNFTECRGYDATASYDFHVWHSNNNILTNCYANNSDTGYYVERGHNNTFTDCEGRTHVSYNFKILGSPYNTITRGYANSSAVGILIADDTDTYVAHHNAIADTEVNLATGYAISIGTDGGADNICHNNTVTGAIVTGTTTGDGIFLFDNVTYNNISGCTVTGLTPATSGGMGATNHADYNTFYNCNASSNSGFGYYLLGYANNNTLNLCEARGNLYGMRIAYYANNNSINHSDFNNNTWIGIWVASDGASAGGNEVWSSTCHDNVMGIYIEVSPLISFTEVNAYNNSLYGVVVITNASAYFFNCIVDNPTVTWCDWYVDNTSQVDIYSPYILGFDKNINYQFDTVQPYGVANHDAGDGLWELNTTQMTVHCQSANNTYINLTYWSPTKIRWTATSASGTRLYQKIGGLTPDIRYDLKVSGNVQSINYSESDVMLVTHGTTGVVYFNFSGGWSTLEFEVKRHVPADDSAPGGGTPASTTDTDNDGLTDAFEAIIGTNPLLPDTDFDGYTDYEEYLAGTDPLDATDYPGIVGGLGSFLFIPIVLWLFIVLPVIAVAILQFTYIASLKNAKQKKRYQILLLIALAILAIIGIALNFLL